MYGVAKVSVSEANAIPEDVPVPPRRICPSALFVRVAKTPSTPPSAGASISIAKAVSDGVKRTTAPELLTDTPTVDPKAEARADAQAVLLPEDAQLNVIPSVKVVVVGPDAVVVIVTDIVSPADRA